jgi:FKBP-type peptidyl-prolyl cis-trans isomerase
MTKYYQNLLLNSPSPVFFLHKKQYFCVLNSTHFYLLMSKTKFRIYILFIINILQISNMLAQASTLEDYFQQNGIKPKNTPEGVFYTLEKEGKGALPRKGNYVRLTYVGKLLDGTVFDQSAAGEAFVFRVGVRQIIEGWERGIIALKEGSKATLFVPAKLAYGTRSVGKIPANSPLIFEVNFEKIMTDVEYEKYMENIEAKEKKAFEAQKKAQFEADLRVIADFAKAKKLNTTKTASGLHYVLTKKGKGDLPLAGDWVGVEYEGFLADDTAFDATKKEPYRFILGAGKVIAGWEEGLKFFPKGAEGWLLIPSKLAYGALAIKENNIPPNAVLFFKIKMAEVKKK